MSEKYLGPSHTVIYKDHVYRPGDDIPMNKEEIARMVANGHRFEEKGDTFTGLDSALREGEVGATEQSVPEFGPVDDRGQMLPVKETARGATVIANDAAVKAEKA